MVSRTDPLRDQALAKKAKFFARARIIIVCEEKCQHKFLPWLGRETGMQKGVLKASRGVEAAFLDTAMKWQVR